MSSFDWRQSPAHLYFLATFFKEHGRDHTSIADADWKWLLGEERKEAIDRFIQDGAIRALSLKELLNSHYKVAELKEMCRERNIHISGNKRELIDSLCQHDPNGMEIAVINSNRYEVSHWGKKLAEDHVARPEQTRRLTEEIEKEPAKREEYKKVIRWLLLEGIVLSVVSGPTGNFVYDVLKDLYQSLVTPGETIPLQLAPIPEPAPSPDPSRLSARVKIEWCHVPAGYFLMGSASNDQDARDNEKPQHRVYLAGYWISKYPITNIQYRQFIKATRHHEHTHWENGYPEDRQHYPVVDVSWSDAVAFCQWASHRTGQTIRLPTEAEWEKAARGTDGRIYPWGNRWQIRRCNNKDAGVKDTTPVRRYPLGASPYGVHDMAGNVWEWTSTISDKEFSYPYQADDGRENPDSVDKNHVLRGGYWDNSAKYVRAGFRTNYGIKGDLARGFRVVSASLAPF